ncbi:MAG: TIGR02677 family protein [Gammaproteobacteria bacterium]|nr:TIGR02677 family protein [Gammaproteobacteria bacterium]
MTDSISTSNATLFRHVTTDHANNYRTIMHCFAAAKRQFRLHLRPDEILLDAQWPAAAPGADELTTWLAQLVDWGNLQAQPDTARVSTIEDFYRKRLLYRLTPGGEAAEVGLQAFAEALARKGELQSVALADILDRLEGLAQLARDTPPDTAKVHEALRDLVNVFAGLAQNAEAFMAGLARTLELQRAELDAVMAFKTRLIDYLERFIGDLVERSSRISLKLRELGSISSNLLRIAAEREAHDAAPGDAQARNDAVTQRIAAWEERWSGLLRWFVSDGRAQSQSELLRASARAAIPRLLSAVSTLNERRAGRSDRSADFRTLALWFAETRNVGEAHRLWRAAFGLAPARHLSLAVGEEVSAAASWRDAPPLPIHPRLREVGQLATRGGPPRIQDRSRERALLAAQLAEEAAQLAAARARLATGRDIRLSELGALDRHAFRLFLNLLGEALAVQVAPHLPVERASNDGLLLVRLEPLSAESVAVIETELGRFMGRDHLVLIRAL